MIVVCTPTTNRRWAYEWSKACLLDQEGVDIVAWVVVDNSDDPEADWSPVRTDEEVASRVGVVYEKVEGGRRPIGWLRNRCLEHARLLGAHHIVFWDDDDYYPPQRIRSALSTFAAFPDSDIVGSSAMPVLLTGPNVFMTIGAFHDRHATAATWVVTGSYASRHRFDDTLSKGEERSFTQEWTANLTQMKAEDAIVVLGHAFNTVDKTPILHAPDRYRARIVNDGNGKQYFRSHWPVRWDLFRSTFSV